MAPGSARAALELGTIGGAGGGFTSTTGDGAGLGAGGAGVGRSGELAGVSPPRRCRRRLGGAVPVREEEEQEDWV